MGTGSTLEQVCAWAIKRGYSTGHADSLDDVLHELAWQIRDETAERCARVCEQAGMEGYGTIAAAIEIRTLYNLNPLPTDNTKW
jgi:hypothetical protein